jgi:DNA (cytosine-5)-methyltransferase 1
MKNEQRTSELHKLRTLHLFAGAGGGILADILLGHHPVCAVEIEPYCQQVLSARQKDGHLPWFPIFDDVQTFDGRPWRGLVDVVAGGFPCQDISAAGKGAGIEGSRSSMWKHMARIIGEVRPRYAFVENSPMLVGRGLSTVLADLAEMGYDAKWGIVGAHHVSAPHKRDRIWILAYTDLHSDKREIDRVMGEKEREARENESLHSSSWNAIGASKHEWEHSVHGLEQVTKESCGDVSNANVRGCNDGSDSERQYEANYAQVGQTAEDQQSGSIGQHWTSSHGCDVADSVCNGLQRSREEWRTERSTGLRCGARRDEIEQIPRTARDWWDTEPNVGRVAHGVANRVDRLKAIGNGQVPQVAALAWQVLTNRLHEKIIDT